MDQVAAMRMFVRVVESGSFSAVAREAGVGQPAVSKQITALEAHLGAQLLRRTSRSLSVTEAGQDFYESAVRLIGDLEAAESRVGRGQNAPSGLIRVTVAPVFGHLYIVPRLHEFFGHYPEIVLEFVVTDRTINLIEEGIDLAIHNGELKDSTLIAQRIAATPVITVASPDYLAAHGEPMSPSDLDRHRCIIFAPQGAPRPWGFAGKFGDIEFRPSGNFRTNDADQIRAAVLAGLGLAHTPGWLFAREIASGEVRVVLRDYEPTPLSVSAVHPAGRRLATKVRVFIAFLARILAEEPSLAISSPDRSAFDKSARQSG
jgi:LysR family transcriptional regulator, regulator for bpeEF and oprC